MIEMFLCLPIYEKENNYGDGFIIRKGLSFF